MIFAQAIKNVRAAEAVRLLNLCLKRRMSRHQTDSRTNRDTAVKREWFRACDNAVEGNPYMEGASPVSDCCISATSRVRSSSVHCMALPWEEIALLPVDRKGEEEECAPSLL